MHDGKSYFFVGIGGSGMMPLAMILASKGARVAGSDRTLDQDRLPAKFADLRAKGVALFPQDGSGITSANQIVVASAAVESTVADIVAADAVGAKRMSRAELLAKLFNAAPLPIGVAGTSGKSTVTGMIGWILHTTGRDPTVMNGAVMKNFAGEDAPFASALVGGGEAFVSEVDESDGSIALYWPKIAVLNNVSLDHKSLDELRTLFGDFIARSTTAVINLDNADGAALATTLPPERCLTFSIGLEADLVAIGLVQRPFGVDFSLSERGAAPVAVSLKVPGRHNVSNALAAIDACKVLGVDDAAIDRGLESFAGLPHRMERVASRDGVAFVNDSKATNPESTAPALAAFSRIHWILGGQAKTDDLDACAPSFGHVARAYTIGEAGPRFAAILAPHMPVEESGTLAQAVTSAAANARTGDTVLLSPACASFDQFRDFEDRGDQFRALVGALA